MNLLRQLEAMWKLDESSGNATDSSGHGWTLTNTNTVTYSAGKLNNAANFVAASSQRFVSTAPIVSGTRSAVSSSCWMYRSSTSNLVTMSVGLSGSGGIFATSWLTDGNAYVAVQEGQYGHTALSGTGWHHLVTVYDGSLSTDANRLKLYIDSVQATITFDASGVGSTTTNAAEMYVGWNRFDGYSTGSIDEVAYWSRALTQAEVNFLYGVGTPPAFSRWGRSVPLVGSGLVQ